MEGIKYDQEKLRYDLLPIEPLEEVVKVLMLGSKKYADNNWMKVEPYEKRYYSAALRHILSWRKGEIVDKETNLHHIAHAICCLMFILWKERNYAVSKTKLDGVVE